MQEKAKLFELLDNAISEGVRFCTSHAIDLESLLVAKHLFNRIGIFGDFANKLSGKEQYRKEFKVYENTITSLYEACKPEILGTKFRSMVPVFQYLRGVTDSIVGKADNVTAFPAS